MLQCVDDPCLLEFTCLPELEHVLTIAGRLHSTRDFCDGVSRLTAAARKPDIETQGQWIQ